MPSTLIQYNFKAEELVRTGRTSSYNIDGIREWLELMPTIPQLSDEQIAIFLVACKNDIEATKTCIVCFFKYKAAAPELFDNRDVDTEEMIHTLKVANVAIMPERTKENYAVICAGLKDTSYSSFHVDSHVKMIYTIMDLILHDNPPAGLVVIIDIKGVGLMHITRLKLSTVKKFFQFLQEALPTQLKFIHIMNTSYVFDKIITILKPFMNKELFDMIITHPPNKSLEYFYEKYIPKELLPADLGGDLTNLEQLKEDTRLKWRKSKNYLDSHQQQIEDYRLNRS
ncbi:alpha-tocopherol transfer protein-like [Anthonomus grandis grandis]|uniref:alpha-tocopherol transfer protein-like n=1 Tax=Anthonomus grandis grandis TaxID=2921223 RepID=UPI0021669212|nr:alpha-tocopherol transfer protein-like [Anthonomus grandis grandis]